MPKKCVDPMPWILRKHPCILAFLTCGLSIGIMSLIDQTAESQMFFNSLTQKERRKLNRTFRQWPAT